MYLKRRSTTPVIRARDYGDNVTDSGFEPAKITRPFQLLAAWLTGLIAVNAAFLAAAASIKAPLWVPAMLSIAAVVNVPLFLACVFLLQTKYRPQLQEDSYYSKYLERETQGVTLSLLRPPGGGVQDRAEQLAKTIVELQGSIAQSRELVGPTGPTGPTEMTKALTGGATGPITQLIVDSEVDDLAKRYSANRTMAELLLRPANWARLASRFVKDVGFLHDLRTLTAEGLAEAPDGVPARLKLTDMGKRVATRQQELGIGFNTVVRDIWDRDACAP